MADRSVGQAGIRKSISKLQGGRRFIRLKGDAGASARAKEAKKSKGRGQLGIPTGGRGKSQTGTRSPKTKGDAGASGRLRAALNIGGNNGRKR